MLPLYIPNGRGFGGGFGAAGSGGAEFLDCGLRLTSVSNTPILTTTQLAKTTLFDTPFLSNQIGIYSGSAWVQHFVGETSLSTSGFTASRMHDIYGFMSGGVYTIEAVAWSDNTTPPTRGTQNGVLTKNGDATKRYRGSVYVNGSKEIEWQWGAVSAGCTAAKFMVWNESNRIKVRTFFGDSANTWTHANNSTWSQQNGSDTARATFAIGRTIEPVMARTTNRAVPAASTSGSIAIGLDSTSSPASNQRIMYNSNTSGQASFSSEWSGYPGVGLHYLQALDYSTGGTTTFYGDNGYAYLQTGTEFDGYF